MKFDFIIGNPPYQEETSQKEITTNGQTPKKNIFHYFQMQADKIANEAIVLIYPAGRWIHRSGKGMADFGLNQINDTKLQKIILYANAKDVFQGVAIADGISIVLKNTKKKDTGFKYVFIKDGKQLDVDMENPGEDLIPLDPRDISIIKKVEDTVLLKEFDYLHNHILPRSLFGIESDFVEKNPQILRIMQNDEVIDYSYEVKIFTNDKAGKSGRAKWFVGPKNIIKTNSEYINEWQVVVSSANAGGQKRDNQLEVMDNHSAFGRSRVALRSFKTEEEAHNFYLYVSSYVIRYAFLMTDEALSSLGKRVPDLLDYTTNSGIIDFSSDIDQQLCLLFDFTEEEMAYIRNRVDSVRGKAK